MRNILTILSILLLSCGPTEQKISPKAINGVLDLRPLPVPAMSAMNQDLNSIKNNSIEEPAPGIAANEWNFFSDGIINLDGEWEFYWQEFIEPDSPPSLVGGADLRHLRRKFIRVPGSWNGFNAGTDDNPELVKGDAHATYRLTILVNKNQDSSTLNSNHLSGLSLLLPIVSTAYKLYINGRLITSVGEAGQTADSTRPAYNTKIVRLPKDNSGKYVMIIHVSNYHYRIGGLWNSFKMGRDADINNLRERNLFFDFFVAGSLFFMGLYHLGLFTLRKKDRTTLWFGIICLLVGIQNLFTGEYTFYNFFPKFSWAAGIRIEFLAWYLNMPLLLLFIRNLFPQISFKWADLLFQGIFYIAALAVLIFPSRVFSQTVPPMIILTFLAMLYFILILSRAKKQEGLAIFYFAGGIILLAISNDLLNLSKIVQTGYFFSEGLFIFLFFQTYLLSTRFSRSFNLVEELSETLEKKVISRTELLDIARLKAEEASTLKDKFVGLISHDIRSPLSGVYRILERITGLDYVKQKKEVDELLTLSKKSLALSLQMVEQVLDLSRMQSGKILPLYEKIDLSQIASDALSKISSQAKEKKITISNSILDSVFFYADPTLLSQILLNLLNNSVKFSRCNDAIELKHLQKNGYHVIQIVDTGTGIDEKYLPNLFDATVKTSSTGTIGETGSGLGLPLSSEMTHAMNGNITARSILGEGSSLSVSLPDADKMVLIIDDNEIWRSEFRDFLQQEDIIIQEAENGESALAILDKLWPDLIVTDINMPVMDGFMLIQKIRENPEFNHIPIVVATSGILENKDYAKTNREMLLKMGANEVILKPVDKSVFIELVNNIT